MLIVGGTAATGTAAAGVGEGRVAHYPLNNLEGRDKNKDQVHDASPYGNDGTNEGATVVRGGGRVGNAFRFNLADQVELPAGIINADAIQSRVAWVKPTNGKDGGYPRIFHQHNTFELAWYQPAEKWAVWDGSTWYEFGDAPTGEWGHVGVVWDGTNLIGYDDGTPHELATNGGSSSTGKINMGKNPDPGGDKLAGMIDEARIYDRALSSEEVGELASMGSD